MMRKDNDDGKQHCLMCGAELTKTEIENSINAGSEARCNECEWKVVLAQDRRGEIA